MEKYNHKKIEAKWQKVWARQTELYAAEDNLNKPKFYCLDMFPYPSGAGLHAGHVESYTATDIMSRYMRLRGKNVLHPQGWDAFGLPAENYAVKTKIHPVETTRRAVATFKKQMNLMGFSYDWSRELNSSQSDYYKWTQWFFLLLYKNDLAYKKKAKVNWCPSCRTVLANEQAEGGVCERCQHKVIQKDLKQWFFKITDFIEDKKILTPQPPFERGAKGGYKIGDRKSHFTPGLLNGLNKVDWPESTKAAQKNWIGKSEGAIVKFPIFSALKDKQKKKVLLGTRNSAKIKMLKACFVDRNDIEFLTLDDINVDDSSLVEGDDFIQNARLKSEFYFKKTGIPTLSTDHGLWIEKWPENNGFIVHIRKLANPESSRATDQEVLEFLKKFLKSAGGESASHFDCAMAYTDASGTQAVNQVPHEYILQTEESKNFWEGYPIESLLRDPETRVFKSEQSDEIRYGKVAEILKKRIVPLIFKEKAIEVFTTRLDTIFGCTYLVVAPEHPLITNYPPATQASLLALRAGELRITNYEEVKKYIVKAKNKTDLERLETKEKTGVRLEGVSAVNPFNGEELPLFVADYVLAHYGTGAIMAVPAHDERDWEFAVKHNLPIKQAIKPKDILRSVVVDITIKAGFREELKKNNIKFEIGLSQNKREHIRVSLNRNQIDLYTKLVQFYLKSNSWVEIVGSENIYIFKDEVIKDFSFNDKKILNICQKFEPLVRHYKSLWEMLRANLFYKDWICYVEDGVLVNSGEYTGLTSAEAREKMTAWLEKENLGRRQINYKIRDWLVSRQRYWGAPIPILYCEKCGTVPVPEKDLPVKLPTDVDFMPTGESPLAKSKSFHKAKCPVCDGAARRESDTMDTFVCSSWYYFRYADVYNKKEFAGAEMLKKWLPVDLYVGGAEHTVLHLLYARFFTKVLHNLGYIDFDEPFLKLRHQGIILAEDGRKMSKSLGNVVNPDEVIKQYGADALRLFEMFMGPLEDMKSWNTKGIIGQVRFLEKIWNLFQDKKFMDCGGCEGVPEGMPQLLHKTIKKVGEDIENLRFNTAISQLMIFINFASKAEIMPRAAAEKFLILLSPFAPHLAEELWQMLGHEQSIFKQEWPEYNPDMIKDEIINLVIQINGKVREVIEVSAEISEEEAKRLAMTSEKIKKWLMGKEVVKIIFVKGRLVNIVIR